MSSAVLVCELAWRVPSLEVARARVGVYRQRKRHKSAQNNANCNFILSSILLARTLSFPLVFSAIFRVQKEYLEYSHCSFDSIITSLILTEMHPVVLLSSVLLRGELIVILSLQLIAWDDLPGFNFGLGVADAENSTNEIKPCTWVYNVYINLLFPMNLCICIFPLGHVVIAVQRCSVENQNGAIVVMAIAPFWFSTEHLWTAITPFWLSNVKVGMTRANGYKQITLFWRLLSVESTWMLKDLNDWICLAYFLFCYRQFSK